ncbi:MAG: ABC transporter ATP-binding protein, partial [Pararhizobium sp.]
MPRVTSAVAGDEVAASPPHEMPGETETLLRVAGLTKAFGTFKACDAIDLGIRPGEIHALLGEN